MEQELSRHPAFIVAVALAAGMVCQATARHLRIPGIVLLLLSGVLLGPDVTGVVQPEALGPALHLIVGMSVAVILFEGGLNLSLARLRREAGPVRRLVTVGALITAAGAAVSAWWLLDWRWELAVLFGTLVVVTGPTVMTPLLRRIDVRPNVHTILEAEGVLIDPVGAVLAVVTLEVVLTMVAPGAESGAAELLGLPSRLVLGALMGVAGGGAMSVLLRKEDLVPEGMENALTLALVLALFEASEALQPESGIMAAAVAGIVVGNTETPVDEQLKEFKEQLTVMLIGLLFVLLSATVRMDAVLALGWPGLATIGLLMFVVRPLDVAVCTWGSELELRERAFLSWLAPRGIVAAAVSSLFAQWLEAAGFPGGRELQAMVFLVIGVTVVLQGGTGGLVADALGIRREEGEGGWVVAGANELGRALARGLQAGGGEVVLIDANARVCQEAEREGLTVVYGDATSERARRQAEMRLRQGMLSVTPNSALNVLLAREIGEGEEGVATAAALDLRSGELGEGTADRAGVRTLFGRPVELDDWRHWLDQGMVDLAYWRLEDGTERSAGDLLAGAPHELLALVRHRDGRTEPVTRDMVLASGDVVFFAWPYAAGEKTGSWLADTGWVPVAPP